MSQSWNREAVVTGSVGLIQANVAATNGTFEAVRILVRCTHATQTLYVGVNDNLAFNSSRALYSLTLGSAPLELDLSPGDTMNLLGSLGATTFAYQRMRLK